MAEGMMCGLMAIDRSQFRGILKLTRSLPAQFCVRVRREGNDEIFGKNL